MQYRPEFLSFFLSCWGLRLTTLSAAALMVVCLGSTIHSDETVDSNAIDDNPVETAGLELDLTTLLQLRREIGDSPLSGSSLEFADEDSRFAETLGEVLRGDREISPKNPQTAGVGQERAAPTPTRGDPEAKLVQMLRTTSALLDEHAATLEVAGRRHLADQLRRVSRRNIKAARSIQDLNDNAH